jgi:hypothetical protein
MAGTGHSHAVCLLLGFGARLCVLAAFASLVVLFPKCYYSVTFLPNGFISHLEARDQFVVLIS